MGEPRCLTPSSSSPRETEAEIALVTIDNGEDYTKPTFFGRAALESLERLLPELEDGDWAALVVTGKPFVFAAGADITQFAGATRELAIEGSRAGHELFGRIRALPYPTVAAINGACLGGGVELALHCDARTISTAVRHFACPECFLGIVPAWGGTQLVPRLVGAETAVKFVVENPMRQNRMLSGAKAFELGFADRLLEPAEFLDESLAFARELAANGDSPRDSLRDSHSVAEVIRKARARLDGQVHGAAPAPYKALELIEGALSGWTLEEGYRAEEDAVGELLPGREAQASLYAFDLVERRAKHPPGKPQAEPRPVRKVGIVGAGLMAAQLAALVLSRLEVPVALRDVSEQALARRARASRPSSPSRSPRAATTRARPASWRRSSPRRPATRASPTATSRSRPCSRSWRSRSRSSPSCASTRRTGASSPRTPRASRSPRWAPTSASTSSTRSPSCRSSSSSAPRRPMTRRSRPPGPSPRSCASGPCSSPTRPHSSSTAS